MTPAGIITEVRRLLQDSDTTQRYSDTVLLGFVNQTLKRIALLRPDLFARQTTMTCETNAVVQSAPNDSYRMMDVFSVVGGGGVVETTREQLDQARPTWVTDVSGSTENWMRNLRNPNKFFIYPKSPAGQQLNIEYSQTPIDYASGDTILFIPETHFPTIVDGAVFLAESIDNEHVNSGRAKLYYDAFIQGLSGSASNRLIADSESAGENQKDVIEGPYGKVRRYG